jgi:hypothetical protein
MRKQVSQSMLSRWMYEEPCAYKVCLLDRVPRRIKQDREANEALKHLPTTLAIGRISSQVPFQDIIFLILAPSLSETWPVAAYDDPFFSTLLYVSPSAMLLDTNHLSSLWKISGCNLLPHFDGNHTAHCLGRVGVLCNQLEKSKVLHCPRFLPFCAR